MRRHPGKWFVLLLVPFFLLAGHVELSVDKHEIAQGDTVTFTITAEGDDVSFPVIREVGGFPVLGTSQRSNISIINGRVTKSVAKSYTFAPMQDVTIPALTVTVDAEPFQTDPVKIRVLKSPKHSSGGSEAELKIRVDKTHVMVGEPIKLDVVVKYKENAGFVQLDLQPPEFPNFWIKKVGDAEDGVEGAYRTKTQHYLLFPQKAGSYTLGPLTVRLARRVRIKQPFANDPFLGDDFFNGFFAKLKWSRIASNSVQISVDPLPGGVELYGRFDIIATVDKSEVEANRPVRLTIRISGEGNIDDIGKFEPKIPDAVVYADDPVIKERLRNGRYGGTFEQTVTIIADHDFTIPALSLRYYDSQKRELVEKRTKPLHIKVIGGVPAAVTRPEQKKEKREEPSVQKEAEAKSSESTRSDGWLYLIAGFLFGAGSLYGFMAFRRRPRASGSSDVVEAVLRAKNDKRVLELLLPYAAEDGRLKEIVRRLEENLFGTGNNKIDKKEIVRILEEILPEESD
jgi:hypothetical protein